MSVFPYLNAQILWAVVLLKLPKRGVPDVEGRGSLPPTTNLQQDFDAGEQPLCCGLSFVVADFCLSKPSPKLSL